MDQVQGAGIPAEALALLGWAWETVGSLDGRTAFLAGFLTCLVAWRVASLAGSVALRLVLATTLGAAGMGSAGFVAHLLGSGVPAAAVQRVIPQAAPGGTRVRPEIPTMTEQKQGMGFSENR